MQTYFLKCKETKVTLSKRTYKKKWHLSIQLIWNDLSLWMPWDPRQIWKDVFYPRHPAHATTWDGGWANALSLAATSLSEVGAETWPCVKSENNVFSNQSGILAPSQTRVKQDELYGAILCLFSVIFNIWSPHQLQLFKENAKTLFCCEAPEMFCVLQNVTWLSSDMAVSRLSDISFLGELFKQVAFLFTV